MNIILCALFLATTTLPAFAAPVNDDQKKIFIDEQIRLAEGLRQREYYRLAIEEYQRIIAAFPDEPLAADAWCGLAETFCLAGDYKSGAEAYAKFLEKYPALPTADAVKIAYAAALARSAPQKADESVKLLKDIADNPDKDEKIRESAIYSIAKLLLDMHNDAEAEKYFKALAEKPLRGKDDRLRAVSRMEYSLLIAKSNLPKAIQLLDDLANDKLLDAEQRNSATRISAELLFENEKFQEAAEKYKQLYIEARGTPDAEDAIIGMAFSILQYGGHLRISQEFPAYLSELRSERKKMKLIALLALSSEQEKNFDKALSFAETALASPDTDPESTALAAKILVRTLIETRKYSVAFSRSLNMLADSRIQKKNRAEIIEIIVRAPSISHQAKKDFLDKAARFSKEGYDHDFITLKKAEILFDENSFDAALCELRKIKDETVKKFSASQEAKCLEKLGRGDLATEKYREIIFGNYDSRQKDDAMISCASFLLDSGKADEARKLLQEFISVNTESKAMPFAFFYYGFASMKLDDFDSAASSFEKCLNHQDIEDYLAMQSKIYLCWSLLLADRLDEAFSVSEDILSDNFKRENADPDFIMLLGEKLFERGKYLEAKRCFSDLTSRGQLSPGILWSAKYALSLCERKLGNFEKAVKALDGLEDSNMNDADILCKARALLGELHFAMSRNAEAAASFERCLQIPKDRASAAKARLGLAKILSESPEHLQRAASYAVQAFVTAEDQETITEAMMLYMEISIAAGNPSEAKKTLEDLRQRYPGFSASRLDEIEKRISATPPATR